jgi:hypothetical protein
MRLLDLVADQALSSSLAKFTMEAQITCQSFCETEMRKTTGDSPSELNQNLSQESARALEKQCNKQCIKKFIKSYMLYNKIMKPE